MRSTTFDQGFALDIPFQAAFEIHAMLPETPIYISLLVGGEFEDLYNYYIMGGFGLGVVW